MYVPEDCYGVGGRPPNPCSLKTKQESIYEGEGSLWTWMLILSTRMVSLMVFLGGWKFVSTYFRTEKTVLPCYLRNIINNFLHMKIHFISPPGMLRVHREINAVLQWLLDTLKFSGVGDLLLLLCTVCIFCIGFLLQCSLLSRKKAC